MSNRKKLLDSKDSSYGGDVGVTLATLLIIGGILAGVVLSSVALGLQQTSQSNLQSEIATLANVSFYSTPVNVIGANFTSSSTPIDADGYVTQIFDTIVPTTAQQGFSWNTTSGLGTCLVGGTYDFTWSLSGIDSSVSTDPSSKILQNGAIVKVHYWQYIQYGSNEPIAIDGSYDTQSFQFNLRVNAGDQLEFRVYPSSSDPLRSALFGYTVRQ